MYNDIFVIIGINIYSNSYCNWSYFIRLGLFNVLSANIIEINLFLSLRIN